MGPLVTAIASAYTNSKTILDTSNSNSALSKIRVAREDVFDNVGDITNDTHFESTLSLANTIRLSEKTASTQTLALLNNTIRALDSNIFIVTGSKFRKWFNESTTDRNLTSYYTNDFRNLWKSAMNELLIESQVVLTSYNNGTFVQTGSLTNENPIVFSIPQPLIIKVHQLNAAATISIIGTNAAGNEVNVAVNVAPHSAGTDVIYHVPVAGNATLFASLTGVAITTQSSTTYSIMSGDKFTILNN